MGVLGQIWGTQVDWGISSIATDCTEFAPRDSRPSDTGLHGAEIAGALGSERRMPWYPEDGFGAGLGPPVPFYQFPLLKQTTEKKVPLF